MFFAGMAAIGALYYILSTLALARHFRRQVFAIQSATPKVSVLKPVCGLDPELRYNLLTYLSQDYPDYEVLFGVLEPDDAALPVIEELANSRSEASAHVGSAIQGSNNKVRILHELATHATGEILVLTDADTRATPDFLTRLVAPFEDQNRGMNTLATDPQRCRVRHEGNENAPHFRGSVGLVSCFYRGANARSLADALGALYLTCTFEPGAACAKALGKVDFALGAAVAIRRSVLEQFGGFESFVDYLADDFQIGHRTVEAGHRVILSDYVIEIALPGEDLAAVLGRELRWCRISRISRPMGHLGLVFTFGFAWAVVFWLASGLSAVGWAVLAGVAVVRAVTAWMCARCLGDGEFLHRIQLLPLRDLLSFGVWVAGFFSRQVTWRGRKLRIASDGTMEPV